MANHIKVICLLSLLEGEYFGKGLHLPFELTTLNEASTPETHVAPSGRLNEYENTSLTNQPVTQQTDVNFTSDKTPDNKTEQDVFVYISSLPEYCIYKFLATYFVYITSIPGLVTNPLTIYLSLKLHPQTTSELYMFLLGITDFLNVAMRIIVLGMGNLINIFQTDWSCRVLYFTINTSYIFSNWIVVCWTIERLIAVVFPLQLNVWCTSRKMKTALLVLFLMSCGVSFPHIIYTFLNYTIGGKGYCEVTEMYYEFYSSLENIFYMYLPITIILTGNVTIIYKIHTVAKTRAIMGSDFKREKQITTLLITVAFSFVFLHLPQLVAKIFERIYPDTSVLLAEDARAYVRFYILIVAGYQVTDFQNSVNFFLYCAFGSKVRALLFDKILCKIIRKNAPANNTSQTNISIIAKHLNKDS